MSNLQNAPDDRLAHRNAPRPRVLLLAHHDLAEPTARYLRRLGCDVTAPPFEEPTAEACAALLFPPKSFLPEPREPRLRLSFGRKNGQARVPMVGPPAFFAWGAFDAVVVQDLWLGAEDRRLIPFGCTILTTDYYVRGNFSQPKIALITDPGFYGLLRETSQSYEESLRSAFDRNEQLVFAPVIGASCSAQTLERIATAVRRGSIAGPAAVGVRRKQRRQAGGRDGEAPEQSRAMSVLTSALAGYIAARARVVLIDDAAATVSGIASHFGKMVATQREESVHLCDVAAGTLASHSSFEELWRDCERVVDHSRERNELVLIVTDILFDSVEWDGGRKTGIELIERLRAAQRERHVKIGIVGLTGVASPLVMTSAFQRGADAVVNKSAGHDSTLHHAHLVDEFVIYKLLLTLASLCFQYELLYAKRHVAADRAREESASMRRILPSHAVSPHLQGEWEATQYLLESQATYAHTTSRPAERAIRRIREQYD